MYKFGDKVTVKKGFYEGLHGTLVEIVRENPNEYILRLDYDHPVSTHHQTIIVTNSDLERTDNYGQ